jgi:hypothetical protein
MPHGTRRPLRPSLTLACFCRFDSVHFTSFQLQQGTPTGSSKYNAWPPQVGHEIDSSCAIDIMYRYPLSHLDPHPAPRNHQILESALLFILSICLSEKHALTLCALYLTLGSDLIRRDTSDQAISSGAVSMTISHFKLKVLKMSMLLPFAVVSLVEKHSCFILQARADLTSYVKSSFSPVDHHVYTIHPTRRASAQRHRS